MRRTKIVCTIGPASDSERVLRGLIQAGMNVARLNFSHGDYSFHKRMIQKIRQIARRLDTPVAILQDLPGPKVRIGEVAENRVRLQSRRPFVLTTRKILGSELAVSVNFPGLTRSLKKGDPILLGDGEIELEAVQIGEHEIKCKIIVGGILGSHKGIHFPRSSLNIRSLTKRDKQDLTFGIENKVDLIALSFVRNADDIIHARREIKQRGATIPIIAKIEKHEGLDHIDAILSEVDGIMVARGDLGLEIALEKIPAMQKMMIRKANLLGKPVITATQMLRSMVQNPRPTRAEVADIANAVLDGVSEGGRTVQDAYRRVQGAERPGSARRLRPRMARDQGGKPLIAVRPPLARSGTAEKSRSAFRRRELARTIRGNAHRRTRPAGGTRTARRSARRSRRGHRQSPGIL